jgi:type IV pilus assembly protein PilO
MASNMRKIIFFILLLAMAYLAYAFMIRPANKDIEHRKTDIQSKMTKLSELENATAEARDLGKQTNKLEQAFDFFNNKLPPHSQIHKVLEQVTLIAQKQGLKTKTIRTLKQTECMGYIEQPLKMELYGNFDAYYSFLLELEQMPRITKIRELTLTKDTKNEGMTTAEFVVSIFFQGQENS